MQDMKKAGIAIDAWKLPIFERHLAEGRFTFTNCGVLTVGTLLLQVDVPDGMAQRLAQLMLAANTEAARTRRPA